jgi:hypothetical protein
MTEGSYVPMPKGFQPPARRWPDGVAKPYRFRFFPDYSAGTPFWNDDLGPVPIRALPLSRELAGELEEWNAYFETRFHHERGWTSSADGAWFHREGRTLCDRAQAELGSDYLFTFEVKAGPSPWG